MTKYTILVMYRIQEVVKCYLFFNSFCFFMNTLTYNKTNHQSLRDLLNVWKNDSHFNFWQVVPDEKT